MDDTHSISEWSLSEIYEYSAHNQIQDPLCAKHVLQKLSYLTSPGNSLFYVYHFNLLPSRFLFTVSFLIILNMTCLTGFFLNISPTWKFVLFWIKLQYFINFGKWWSLSLQILLLLHFLFFKHISVLQTLDTFVLLKK